MLVSETGCSRIPETNVAALLYRLRVEIFGWDRFTSTFLQTLRTLQRLDSLHPPSTPQNRPNLQIEMVGTMASSQLHPRESPGPTGGETTASQPSLRYDDLSLDFREIRVLTLNQSSDYDSSIECTLQHTNLDNPLKYTALSYVWGDATITEEILVNKYPFSATTNLVSALRHIRKLDRKITLWVDAISESSFCIFK